MGDAAGDPRELRRTFIVPAIKPFDHYDFPRAKVACNLAWLVAKAFGSEHVPEELREPFYTDQYDQEHIKPPVVQLLLSAELYCRAGSLILKSDAAKPLVGHEAVVQALAQKGLYVTDQERLVTERDLQRRPIQMSAHLAMMDTLMMAYTAEMVSVERVMACTQRFAPLLQAADLPYDIEDAVMYWMNKVNEHLRDILEQEQKLREHHTAEAPGAQKSPSKWFWKLVPARYRKEQTLRQLPCIPLVENLLKDGADGCALAALLHFYCPGVVRLEDICLKETMSLADSLYNLQLVQEFCQEHLTQCCHFSLEDMLYAAASIKSNYLVFMAELFWWFEVVKPSFVQPRTLRAQGAEPAAPAPDARASTADSSPGPASAGDVFPHRLSSRHARPQPPAASGGIRRSSSMSYVDGFIGTWPKEKRSSVHGVSFDISFDKENAAPRSAPSRGIPRSVSNEGLSLSHGRAARTTRKSLTFQPVNGEGEAGGIAEELGDPGGGFPTYVPHPPPKLGPRENSRPRLPNGALQPRLLPGEPGGPGETPSIEEALQIIHDTEQRPPAAPPGHVANGFFLHSQDPSPPPAGLQLRPPSPDPLASPAGAPSPGTDDTEVDTGIHVPSEDLPGTVDEDSSLRDYTVSLDSDTEDAPKLPREAPSPCPSSVSARSQPGSSASSSSGVRMTSFAEQKFRKLSHTDGRSSGSSSQKTTPEGSELNIPHVVGWAPGPEDAGPPGRDSAQLLASEVLQLRMRLEEKRRAIEAQKRKVEAAFTRQRQRMGRTAFLSVVKRRADGAPLREEAAGAEDEQAFREPEPGAGGQRGPGLADIKEGAEGAAGPWPPSPTAPGDPGEEPAEGEVLEYTRSIEKLNASLGFLQQEMQRLAQQQEALMRMRDRQAWVVSPPQPRVLLGADPAGAAAQRAQDRAADAHADAAALRGQPPAAAALLAQPGAHPDALLRVLRRRRARARPPGGPRAARAAPGGARAGQRGRGAGPARDRDRVPDARRRRPPARRPARRPQGRQPHRGVALGPDGPGEGGRARREGGRRERPGAAGRGAESVLRLLLQGRPEGGGRHGAEAGGAAGEAAAAGEGDAAPPAAAGGRAGAPQGGDAAEDGGGAAAEGGRAGAPGVHPPGVPAAQAAEAHGGHGHGAAAPPRPPQAQEAAPQVHAQGPRGAPQDAHPGPASLQPLPGVTEHGRQRERALRQEDAQVGVGGGLPVAEPLRQPQRGEGLGECVHHVLRGLGDRVHRTKALQGAQRQVQQAHHPERVGALLPGGQGERGPEEAHPRGDGEVGREQLPDPVPGLGLPVPVPVHVLPGHGGHRQADGHRAQGHQQEDDRGPLQVQLGPQAVQPHPRQDAVGQRGRHHHPQPPVAEQAACHAQEAAARQGVGGPGRSWPPPPPAGPPGRQGTARRRAQCRRAGAHRAGAGLLPGGACRAWPHRRGRGPGTASHTLDCRRGRRSGTGLSVAFLNTFHYALVLRGFILILFPVGSCRGPSCSFPGRSRGTDVAAPRLPEPRGARVRLTALVFPGVRRRNGSERYRLSIPHSINASRLRGEGRVVRSAAGRGSRTHRCNQCCLLSARGRAWAGSFPPFIYN